MRIKGIDKGLSIYIVIALMVVTVGLLGSTSYALIQRAIRGTKTYTMRTGNFLVEFTNNNSISLTNTVPTYDNIGASTGDEFVFSVTNNGDYKARYSVKIEETSAEPIGEVIRYAVDSGDGYSISYRMPVGVLSDNPYIVLEKSLNVKSTDEYRVRFWLDIDATEQYIGKTFTAKIVLEATQDTNKYATDVIESLYNSGQDNVVAIGTDHNLYTSGDIMEYRYSGNVTTNYVWFNCDDGYTSGSDHCEKWRIIGVFDNHLDEDSKLFATLKLVRDEMLATTMPFGGDTFYTSSINTYLNGDSSGNYYYSLSSSAKKMIGKFRYHDSATSTNNSSMGSYSLEGAIVNDERDHYYNVGLITASDYGYASISSNWSNALNSSVYASSDNWLHSANNYMIINVEDLTDNIYYVGSSGIAAGTSTTSYYVRPVVYVRPDVSIIGGFGTSDKPYELSIKHPLNMNTYTTPKTNLSEDPGVEY